MGGKSQPAPDYSAMAAASKEAAATAERLGNRQLDFSEKQYNEMLPIAQKVAQAQIDAQTQQMEQGKEYYDYWKNTYQPLEKGLVADAEKFSTEGYREGLARDAAAAAGKAFGINEQAAARASAARGVNPNSGAALAMQNQNMLGLSAGRAQAMTGARQQAEQMGWARRLDVTGLGRGLSGASTAAYSGATGAGSAGMGTSMAPGSAYSADMARGAGTIMGGQSLNVQGMGNVLSAQTSAYNTGVNASGEMIGGLVSGAGKLGAAALPYIMSDTRLKQNIKQVGVDKRTKLPLYEFSYKSSPHKRYRGVMAQDVETKYPDAVKTMPNGYKAVNYHALGMDLVEV
jgi:hypothetical protein